MRYLNRFVVLFVLLFIGCRYAGDQNADAENVAGPLTAAQARQALNELLDAPPGKRVDDHDWLVSLRPALNDPERFEGSADGLLIDAWNVVLSDRSFCALIMRKHFRVTWSGTFQMRADGTWEAKVTSCQWVDRVSRDED